MSAPNADHDEEADVALGNVQEQENPPLVKIDYRVFSVLIQGSDDDTLDDVYEYVQDAVDKGIDDVNQLKRDDRELTEEFAPDDANVPQQPATQMSRMTQ